VKASVVMASSTDCRLAPLATVKDDEQELARSQDSAVELQLLTVRNDLVHDGGEPGVGEVGGECARVVVAESHLPGRLLGRLTQGPDATADDELADEVAVEQGRSRECLGDQA
jgi:hypothetical protein